MPFLVPDVGDIADEMDEYIPVDDLLEGGKDKQADKAFQDVLVNLMMVKDEDLSNQLGIEVWLPRPRPFDSKLLSGTRRPKIGCPLRCDLFPTAYQPPGESNTISLQRQLCRPLIVL
jgi:hypothetical protein